MDIWVLDVHCGHVKRTRAANFFMWDLRQGTSITGRRGALFLISLTLPVESLVDFILDSMLESFCFRLHREIQSDLTVIRSEGMKERQR